MRKEETILKQLEKLKDSKYVRFNHAEIGVLLWVLGKANTPRAGAVKSYKETEEQRVNTPTNGE